MNKAIKVLNDLTINKIAAGEVVEGPHSVVKELIENAIDANATNIIVEIKEGGQTYIKVSDNGMGIVEEDINTAFLRHATSKIDNIEDLNSIYSLGFRGEALASIAAVSQIKIITKPEKQFHGISLDMVNGHVINKKQIGAPNGTTIIVKNLFFNTPARLKFMKSPQSETRKISEIVSRLALSQPQIAIKYINNNNIMFTTPGNGNIDQTILSIFNKDLFKKLIGINSAKNNIELSGYISQPTYVRGNRNYEIIFVNGRYVKNQLVYKAIEDAYKEKLPINKFPACILNLHISPHLIDVNVHPTKTIVKFDEEIGLYQFIYNTIKSSLSENVIIPTLTFHNKNQIIPSLRENKSSYNTHNNYHNDTRTSKQIKLESFKQINTIYNENNNTNNGVANKFEEVRKETQITQESFLNSILDNYKIIGQLFSTYIIIEKDLSMYLIDQHAAHERLVYNKMLNEFKNNNIVTQQLLEPKVLELSNEDYVFVMEYINVFLKIGFSIDSFGLNTIIIREVPLILGNPRDFNFLFQIIDELKSDIYNEIHFNETIIRKSCREAIKAMDKLSVNEIHQLIRDLSKIPPPLTCPHGRPILLSISKHEIEKNFKRIQ